MVKPIQVVDLFAGPGGLGEGFNSLRGPDGNRRFKTLVSVEKEPSAHRTLTLRAFYRILLDSGKGMSAYFEYVQGGNHPKDREDTKTLWDEASQEAMSLELGGEQGNGALEARLRKSLDHGRNWILIGGPPCQAYSIVGRSRNKGNKEYRPEEDKRHFLYREYLEVIAKHRPAIFVMENVKGILSSEVGKKRIFGQILEDLHDPTKATGHEGPGNTSAEEDGYTIFSLANEQVHFPRAAGLFGYKQPLEESKHDGFLVKAEEYGIPQSRHRVILVGIRNDIVLQIGAPIIARKIQLKKIPKDEMTSTRTVLHNLPRLRSGLSRHDSEEAWYASVRNASKHIAGELEKHQSEHVNKELTFLLAKELRTVGKMIPAGLARRHIPVSEARLIAPTSELEKWYHGAYQPQQSALWLNHEARTHMDKDLARYVYCAAFAKLTGRSPRAAKEIYLDYLAPQHANWNSGNFNDRFKVVLEDKPSQTITSHISKDGHYFIHHDPYQCRSLTVREAARLQTFPDDYYFEGNRTEQYVQVGNAVPPLLAKYIAKAVISILEITETNYQQ